MVICSLYFALLLSEVSAMGIINSQQKQYLNLSEYANSILESDMDLFQVGESKAKFINRIIACYFMIHMMSFWNCCRPNQILMIMTKKVIPRNNL